MKAVLTSLLCLGIPASLSADTKESVPHVAIADLKGSLHGKEVVMTFKVENTYRISGSVPKGQVPSFGITPVLEEGSPRLSILVCGDLSNLMRRFGLLGPHDPAKGLVMKARGKITVFEARPNRAHEGPSFQLAIRDWKGFRILPSSKPPGKERH